MSLDIECLLVTRKLKQDFWEFENTNTFHIEKDIDVFLYNSELVPLYIKINYEHTNDDLEVFENVICNDKEILPESTLVIDCPIDKTQKLGFHQIQVYLRKGDEKYPEEPSKVFMFNFFGDTAKENGYDHSLNPCRDITTLFEEIQLKTKVDGFWKVTKKNNFEIGTKLGIRIRNSLTISVYLTINDIYSKKDFKTYYNFCKEKPIDNGYFFIDLTKEISQKPGKHKIIIYLDEHTRFCLCPPVKEFIFNINTPESKCPSE